MKSAHGELIEGVKEFLRVVLLAVIPVVISSLESGQIVWRSIAIVAALAALRAAEKVLHKKDSKYQLPI